MPVTVLASSSTSAYSSAPDEDGFVGAFGGRYYRIHDSERLPPFLMNVVSASDLWLFVASNGAVTAGRRDSDGALFPYQPVDRLYDSAFSTGPFTACWVNAEGDEPVLWQPLAPRAFRPEASRRALYKSVVGDRVWFEELNEALGLTFRYGWSVSAEHGLVRTVELQSQRADPCSIRLLDGLRNLLMPGVTRRLQEELSCLADAYKLAERVDDLPLAVFGLASGITDRPDPLEVLRCTAVWAEGLSGARVALSDRQIEGFLQGAAVAAEPGARGRRASFLVATDVVLEPGAILAWQVVADIGLDAAQVEARAQLLRSGRAAAVVKSGCERTTQRLHALVAAADGVEVGGDETAAAHHFANVLFNCARGGAVEEEGRVAREEFLAYVRSRNRRLAPALSTLLAEWPEALPTAELRRRLAAHENEDLRRLALEFLPLSFSRRHGDPSRPWNRFNVRTGPLGRRVIHYEGNWRDLFQNWEALALSFPEHLPSMIMRFVNASTRDGFNPYRLTSEGVDWEVPNPDDPWASIGYWGDHQVVYLLKLLEWSERYAPGALVPWLRSSQFVFVAVPYRLKDYEEMLVAPRHTITFLPEEHRRLEERARAEGSDARLLRTPEGELVRVNLTEKLLLVALARLVHLVPEAGIWLNAQRPEWNDGNNALVGAGASVVTLAYLRRFLLHWRERLLPELGLDEVSVSAPLAQCLEDTASVWRRHRESLNASPLDPRERRQVVDGLGRAGTTYRRAVYAGEAQPPVLVAPSMIADWIDQALIWTEHSLRANRRSDGMYHAYNLVDFSSTLGACGVQRLPLMLEGQVAILSSGLLTAAEARALLQALRRSDLYRSNQDSFLLQPVCGRPGFMDRGVVRPEARARHDWVSAWVQTGDERVLVGGAGATGRLRFHPDLVNRSALEQRLAMMREEPIIGPLATRCHDAMIALYEESFGHRNFLGRSGAMFAYEGIGSIYWHMVAKLLLAVQEVATAAERDGSEHAGALWADYAAVRGGLGSSKTAVEFGAFPTDPYSHTPERGGAQQPGMTGQVKEEILTRWGERGVVIDEGHLAFDLTRLQRLPTSPTAGKLRALDGSDVVVPAGAFGFTVCGTPVIVGLHPERPRLRLHWRGGRCVEQAQARLDEESSRDVFSRSGRLQLIEIYLAPTPPSPPCAQPASYSS